jgi:hypothetical protein
VKIKLDQINNVFVLGYKLIGVVLLSMCALAVLMYAGLFLFYMSSRTWATPIVLSPSQEKVLAFQPQIIALESGLDTQKIAFNTSETTKTALGVQIKQIENILSRTDKWRIRSKPAPYSGACQHPIPLEASTRFRNKPAGDSGVCQQVFVIYRNDLLS